MKTKAILIVIILIVVIAVIGVCIFALIDSTESAEEWNEKGIDFGKSGQYERAIECFSKAIELDANYTMAYFYRGKAYGELKQYQEAICDYNEAIKLDENYTHAYNDRGLAYYKLKDYERAICDYNKAIKLDANYTHAYNDRGLAYYKLKDYERAIEDYNKTIEQDENYAQTYNNRGNAYYELKDYERAIEDYNKTIEQDENYAQAYNNRGIAYARLGHYERAMKDFEKAIESNQEPGIMEEGVNDQSQNIITEFSINYDISSKDSARATIYIDIRNGNEYTLWLKFLEFYVKGEHSNITNVEVKNRKRTFSERNCSSSADWDNRFKNLTAYDFCYHAGGKNGILRNYFCVAINKILAPGKVIHYYVSYSIDDFIRASENDTKYLHVPYQPFHNVRVSKCVWVSKCKWFRWDNVPGSDNESLLEILNEDLNITWTENATITKNNNGMIIISSKDEQHSAKIIMDGNRSDDAILEICDGNIRYLKIEEKDGKRYICDTQPTVLKAEDYNVRINLPQDRYHYSKLLTVPHPHPDAIFMNEKSPALSWHFTSNNRNSTHLLIPAYKIQKDSLMMALDTFLLLSLALGIISVILAVKGDKHKRWKLIFIHVVISVVVVVIIGYILFTGLWEIYCNLLLENLQKSLILALTLGFISVILAFTGYKYKWILICSIAVVICVLIIILFPTYF